MRALGLPNTKHFHEITRIEDAIARSSFLSLPFRPFVLTGFFSSIVAEKLKQEGRAELSAAELTEELEDEEGNVYNRKVRLLSPPLSSFFPLCPSLSSYPLPLCLPLPSPLSFGAAIFSIPPQPPFRPLPLSLNLRLIRLFRLSLQTYEDLKRQGLV
jgi:hypothetical protein